MQKKTGVELYLLGPPLIKYEGVSVSLGTRKAVALLARLAADRRSHARPSLVAFLWPESDESHGRGTLRRTLYTITRGLPEKSLVVIKDSIGLGDAVWCDIDVLSDAYAKSLEYNREPTETERARMVQLLQMAADLYRDDFLSGFALKDSVEFDDWRYFLSEELRRKYVGCLRTLILLLRGSEDYESALGYAARWSALDNLDESPHRMIMELHALSGNRAAAIHQYELYTKAIVAEIGEQPSEDLTALSEQIRAGDFVQNRTKASRPERIDFTDYAMASESHPATLLAVRVPRHKNSSNSDTIFMSSLYGLVLRYGGRIDRYVGDTVLIVFGRTATIENAPELAVRAAIDIRGIASRKGLSLICAVSSGVIDSPSTDEQNTAWLPISGPAVNDVLRMALSGDNPRISVSEAIYRSTRLAAVYTSMPSKEKYGHMYRLENLLDAPVKTRGIDGRGGTIIGRGRELEMLRSVLADVKTGMGHIVTIEGRAGVGKSRLVAEAVRDLATSPDCIVLEGRCLDLGVAAGYWPLIDMFRHLIGIRPEDSDAERRKNIEAYLQRKAAAHPEIISNAEETSLFISLLLSTTGLPIEDRDAGLEDPERVRSGVFQAVRDVFIALARETTLLLIFEDLHWADALSLDLISYLIDSFVADDTKSAPSIGLICLYRPDQDHRCRHLPDIANRKFSEGHIHLLLQELTRKQSLDLIESLLEAGETPDDLPGRIYERAQGNPFFTEELVRAFLETGTVDHEQSWSDADETGDAVPRGVERVIRGTTDRLPETLKKVLRAASVLGRVFDDTVLAGVLDEKDPIVDSLKELEDRGLIYEERSVPRKEYSFRHVLTRDAVYAGVPLSERMELHRRAAETMENVFRNRLDPFLERLAYHYECAEDEDAAVRYLHAAGKKAIRASDNVTAGILLERALALVRGWRRGIERARVELSLLVTLGIPVTATTGYGSQEARQVYQRATDLFSTDDRSVDVFAATHGLWRYHVLRADHRRALELSDRLTEMAEDMGDEAIRLEALRAVGCTLAHVGRYAEAEVKLSRGMDEYSPERHRSNAYVYGHDPATTFYAYRAVNLWILGFPEQAEATIDALQSLMSDSNHRLSITYAWTMCSHVFQLTGKVDRVLSIAQKGRSLAKEANLPMFGAFADTQYGWALTETGEIERGIELMSAGLERWDSAGGGAYRPYIRGVLADVYRRHGSPSAASELLRYAEREIEEGGERSFEPETYRLQGEVTATLGDHAVAMRRFERAKKLARESGALSLELRAAISIAEWSANSDAREAATRYLSEVYSKFTEGYKTRDLRLARQMLSEATRR